MNEFRTFKDQPTGFSRGPFGVQNNPASSLHHFEVVTKLPILAILPLGKEDRQVLPFVLDDPNSAASIAIARVLQQLDSLKKGTQSRSILVSSATAGQGKSSVAFNLALSAASDGHRVALVDGDLTNRKLTKSLLHAASFGLTEVANGIVKMEHVLVDDPDLSMAFLPAADNRQGKTRRLNAAQLQSNVFDQLEAYDLVIIDGGLFGSDNVTDDIASAVSDIVLVAEYGERELSELEHTVANASRYSDKFGGIIEITAGEVRKLLPSKPANSNDITKLQASDHQERPIGEQIRDIYRVIVDKRKTIALTTILTLGLMVLYIWTTTPLFSSRVEILVDPRQRQTVESAISPTGLGSSAAGSDILLLESQIEVLQSQNVADALIRSENLADDPEFAGKESSPMVEKLKTVAKMVIYGPQEHLWQKTAYDKALTKLRKRMDVERQRNTYVLGVTVRSKVSEKAAHLANRVAQIYIEQTDAAASTATKDTATILGSKLEVLRDTANQSANAVEAYKEQNNLINANKILVIEQQLSDLNRKLSDARTEVQATLASRNQAKAAVDSNVGNPLGLSDIGESVVMARLQTSLADIEARQAELALVYLDSHPVLRSNKERKVALLASMRQEYARILNRLDVKYKTALEKSSSLETAVSQLEAKMAVSNSNRVKLRELDREAQTNQTIYDQFRRRSKEAAEQIDIPSSTARIISPAIASSTPSHPAGLLLFACALGFGLVLGVIVAFLSHVLFGPSKPEMESQDAADAPMYEQPYRQSS